MSCGGPLGRLPSGHPPQRPWATGDLALNLTEWQDRELGWNAGPSPGIRCGSNADKFVGVASLGAGADLGGWAELPWASRNKGYEEGQSQGQRPREATATLRGAVGLPGGSLLHRLAPQGSVRRG